MNEVENIVAKDEIAHFLHLPKCFQKLLAAMVSESDCMWERINYFGTVTTQLLVLHGAMTNARNEPRHTNPTIKYIGIIIKCQVCMEDLLS